MYLLLGPLGPVGAAVCVLFMSLVMVPHSLRLILRSTLYQYHYITCITPKPRCTHNLKFKFRSEDEIGRREVVPKPVLPSMLVIVTIDALA